MTDVTPLPNAHRQGGQNPRAEAGDVFTTRYPAVPNADGNLTSLKGILFGDETQLFAPDLRAARKMAKARGLGETVTGVAMTEPPYVLPSEFLAAGNLPQALHSACWLGFVALTAKTAKPSDLLGDGGILHNLAHLMLPPEEVAKQGDVAARIREALPRQLRELEARTPGYTRPVPYPAAERYAQTGEFDALPPGVGDKPEFLDPEPEPLDEQAEAAVA